MSTGGRKREKVKIRYKQRVKRKKRTKGGELKKIFRKNAKNVVAVIMLTILAGLTAYLYVLDRKKKYELIEQEKNRKREVWEDWAKKRHKKPS